LRTAKILSFPEEENNLSDGGGRESSFKGGRKGRVLIATLE